MMTMHVFGRLPSGVNKSRIRRAAESAATVAKARQGTVNFVFVSQEKIRALNRLWRKKDQATDVLSFQSAPMPNADKCRMRGEVFVCPAFIKQVSKQERTDFCQEVLRAVIHGILHILGYDHVRPKERERMRQLQESALSKSFS